jgi:hypothetical protein
MQRQGFLVPWYPIRNSALWLTFNVKNTPVVQDRSRPAHAKYKSLTDVVQTSANVGIAGAAQINDHAKHDTNVHRTPVDVGIAGAAQNSDHATTIQVVLTSLFGPSI